MSIATAFDDADTRPSGLVPLLPPLWLWLACGAFWMVLTLVGVQNNLALLREGGRDSTWLVQFHRIISGTGLWMILSPLWVTWSARHAVAGIGDWRRLLVFAGIGVLWVVVGVPFAAFLRDGVNARLAPPWTVLRSPTLLIELLQFAFFIAAGQVWAAQRRLRERERDVAQLAIQRQDVEARLADARLRALRMHVHPHFIFNALNAVTALQRRGDTRAAIAMLVRLSEVMRTIMDEDAPHTVPLAQEVATLERYLAIERERFGSRLRVDIEIDADATAVPVPFLILQPLVENAVRHGLAALESDVRIVVSAIGHGDTVRIAVTNDAPPRAGTWAPSRERGRGLQLTQRRLDAMYGADHHFAASGIDGTITVSFHVPRPR